jgi:hypothetical protein
MDQQPDACLVWVGQIVADVVPRMDLPFSLIPEIATRLLVAQLPDQQPHPLVAHFAGG